MRGKHHTHGGILCTNCGEHGHMFRQCIKPVTSYGVIVVRYKDPMASMNALANSEGSITGFEMIDDSLEFLLIQRRDSLGFIEMMRGKFKLQDVEYIQYHIGGMTEEERDKYENGPFEPLWKSMWGENPQIQYKNEYESARQKWEQLHVGFVTDSGTCINFTSLRKSAATAPATAEWGFPKGRRDSHESDYSCAMRELYEEAGIKEKDVLSIGNMEPVYETFFGSNHVHYCHKYFIVLAPSTLEVSYNPQNIHMKREIGDIRWCTLQEGLHRLSRGNIEKQGVLLRAASLFRNLCVIPTRLSSCAIRNDEENS
jgi:8-oxo-dGTP pyrophosphatase MutT (NUDIX family)